MSLARLGLGTAIMLAWGLPLIVLTLRALRVSKEERLIAGSFLAVVYGLLATYLVQWLVP